MRKSIIFLLSILLASFAFSQNTSWCGTEISPEWMQAFYNRDKSHLTHKNGNYPEVVIPIEYHIVGDNNGNGYYSLEDLFRAHCELQDLYSEANIKFYITAINYINNTNYYNGNNTSSLFTNYNNPDVCNVFFVSQIVIQSGNVCGYSYVPLAWNDNPNWVSFNSGPSRGGVMLANSCMNPGNTTYRHEMGHYLNLPHTFYGWENQASPNSTQNAPNSINGNPVERADGSNCENSGDGFCDTPPDYISERWSCSFDRSFKDPNGTTFIVDKNNFMSYSFDGCSNYLKDDQLAEVNAAAANHRPYLLNLSIPDLSPLDPITNLAPSAVTENLSPSNLSISWSAVERAEYYYLEATVGTFFNPILQVIVSDTFYTFNALTNREYQWRVRPISLLNPCTDFSPIQTFSTARYSADLVSTDISCTGFFDGTATVSLNTSGSLQYYWTSSDPLTNANLQFEGGTSVSNLPQGDYVLYVLRNNVDSLAIPFTIGNQGISNLNLTLVNNTVVAQIIGGQGPYDVIWSNGETGLTLNNPALGNNFVQVTDQNGCQKTESILFTAISSIEDKVEITSVFPNPNQGNIINLQANFKEAIEVDMAIIDLSGRSLMKEKISTSKGSNVLSFDVNQLSNGIYFFQVQYQGAQTSKRFVINR